MHRLHRVRSESIHWSPSIPNASDSSEYSCSTLTTMMNDLNAKAKRDQKNWAMRYLRSNTVADNIVQYKERLGQISQQVTVSHSFTIYIVQYLQQPTTFTVLLLTATRFCRNALLHSRDQRWTTRGVLEVGSAYRIDWCLLPRAGKRSRHMVCVWGHERFL